MAPGTVFLGFLVVILFAPSSLGGPTGYTSLAAGPSHLPSAKSDAGAGRTSATPQSGTPARALTATRPLGTGVHSCGNSSGGLSDDWTLMVCVSTSTPTVSSLDVGQDLETTMTVTYSAATTLGFELSTTGFPSGCPPISTIQTEDRAATFSVSFGCVPTSSGPFDPYFNVSDTHGESADLVFSGVDGGSGNLIVDTPPSADVTISRAEADTGVPVEFYSNAQAEAGIGQVAWAVNAPGLGCVTGTLGSDLNCTPTAPGDYNVTATVTDTNGGSTSASDGTFLVYALPQLRVTPASASSDSGQNATFSATVTGGSGGFSYQWWAPRMLGCLVLNGGATDACTAPSVSSEVNLTVTLNVTDSTSGKNSTSIHYPIFPPPRLNSVISSAPSADVGQTVTLSVSTIAGTGSAGPLSFSWSGLPVGCNSADAEVISCAPTVAGFSSIVATVTDTNGMSDATPGLSFAVDGPLTASIPTANLTSVDVGQSVRFTTVAGGGTGSYSSYAWTGLSTASCTSLSAATVNCTFAAPGTYLLSASVTDSTPWTSSWSSPLAFSVFDLPTVSLATNRTSADSGQLVSFAATGLGGSGGPFTYFWSGLPAGCTPSGSSFVCAMPSLSSPSTFTLHVSAYDSNFGKATAVGYLEVFPAPSLTLPVASPAKINLGEGVSFNTTRTGGDPASLVYTWAGLPQGCSTASSLVVSCIPSEAGTYLVSVSVTDANGYTFASASLGFLSFTVQSPLVVGVPFSSAPFADVGQQVTFQPDISGSGTLQIEWSGLPTEGCSGEGTATVVCDLLDSGTFDIQTIGLENGGSTLMPGPTLAFTVYPDPEVGPVLASASSVDVGQLVTFSVETSALAGVAGLAWSLPGGCQASNASAVDCTPTAAGAYSVNATLFDRAGVSARSPTLDFSVYAPPQVVGIWVDPTNPVVGGTLTLTANVTGGAPGSLTYVWSGLPGGCSSPDAPVVSCSPTSSGSEKVRLTVTDANGGTGISGAASFSVGTSSAGFTLTSPEAVSALLLVILVLLVLLFLVALLLLRRRTSEKPAPPATPVVRPKPVEPEAPTESPIEILEPAHPASAAPAESRDEDLSKLEEVRRIAKESSEDGRSIYTPWTASIRSSEQAKAVTTPPPTPALTAPPDEKPKASEPEPAPKEATPDKSKPEWDEGAEEKKPAPPPPPPKKSWRKQRRGQT